ncbi:MAG: TatD family hydrolase [Candidatus Humimicrobiaceae bacterium]
MYFIDTHAHLDMIKSMTPEESLQRSLSDGVRYIINVGSSIEGSRKSVRYARQFHDVFASVGIHPHDAKDFGSREIKILKSLIAGSEDEPIDDPSFKSGDGERFEKVVAVGETGFDFFRNLSPRPSQEKAFRAHIELAIEYDLPLIIHDRDAHEEILNILKEYSANKNFRGVIHCFSGSLDFASRCIETGLHISYTGVITFPNAKDLQEAVKEIPIEKIFIETDSPFLAPQDKRGKENYPGYVKYIAQKIAELKELTLEEVAAATSKNAEDFFSLTPFIK